MADNDVWLMLAFPKQDPSQLSSLNGFHTSKKGNSYYKIFLTRDEAIASKRKLVEDGVRYLCKKAPPSRRQAS